MTRVALTVGTIELTCDDRGLALNHGWPSASGGGAPTASASRVYVDGLYVGTSTARSPGVSDWT